MPPIISHCLDALDNENVFLIEDFSISSPNMSEVQRLISSFENEADSLNFKNENPETVCGVLRKWLRNLPEPLFTFEHYDSWLKLQPNDSNLDQVISEIQMILFQLQPTNYIVIQKVFRFLYKLNRFGKYNKLTPQRLALSWQSNMLWSQAQLNADPLESMKLNTNIMSGLFTSIIIEFYNRIFLEDSDIVNFYDFENKDAQLEQSLQKRTTLVKSLGSLKIPNSNLQDTFSLPNTPINAPNLLIRDSTSNSNTLCDYKNVYTKVISLADYYENDEGLLNFSKNEIFYITYKHEDGWWEGWKSGQRGFIPSTFVKEIN